MVRKTAVTKESSGVSSSVARIDKSKRIYYHNSLATVDACNVAGQKHGSISMEAGSTHGHLQGIRQIRLTYIQSTAKTGWFSERN